MKRSIQINAPVETVFAFYKNPEQWRDLMSTDVEIGDLKVTKDGVGTYMDWRFKVAGLSVEGFDVFTDVVPNERITERSSCAFVGTWDYTFAAEASGTKLTMEYKPQSFWRLPPLRNVMDLMAARMCDDFLPKLKDRVETLPPRAKPTPRRQRKPAAAR